MRRPTQFRQSGASVGGEISLAEEPVLYPKRITPNNIGGESRERITEVDRAGGQRVPDTMAHVVHLGLNERSKVADVCAGEERSKSLLANMMGAMVNRADERIGGPGKRN
jgi:hypothetical protein